MPLWLIVLGASGLIAYLATRTQPLAAFVIGQIAYVTSATNLQVSGQVVPLAAGTRVYVQTVDPVSTEIRTDSGNVGTIPTSSLSATLPPGVQMQVN